MTMLMVYISALILGFMIVAVIVLAYEIFNCDNDQHDESWGTGKPNYRNADTLGASTVRAKQASAELR
jgi:hypothetical protein